MHIESGFITAFGASLLACLVTPSGIYTVRRFESWGRRHSIDFVCFAVGVLITASFLHIVPMSLAMSAAAHGGLLGGFMALHVLNRCITAFVCERDPNSQAGIGLVPMLGIGFHSFLDGIIHSITFSVSTFTGVLAASGMVLHEFTEGIITYLLLVRGGFGARNALLLALLAAAASTPLGTLLSYPVISAVDLAVSAGALHYVGAMHLLPQAEQEARRYSLLAFGAGIVVALPGLSTR